MKDLPIGTIVVLLLHINKALEGIDNGSEMRVGEKAVVCQVEHFYDVGVPWYTIEALKTGNRSGGVVLGIHFVPDSDAGKVLFAPKGTIV
jgi:hypothetical protein